MTKFKLILLAAIAIAGTAACLMIHRSSHAKLQSGEILLQQQQDKLAGLTTEHQRLSNKLAQVTSQPKEEREAVLARLRGKAEALRKQTSELRRQPLPSTKPQPPEESHPPEYYEQMNKMAGAKPRDARNLACAFNEYANDHNGLLPSNLDQIASYLAKDKGFALSGTNDFDILYQGSLEKLTGIPLGEVALVRDRHTWLTPDGKKKVRVYGMTGGTGQVVESDDDFQSWEAEHIIPRAK